MSSVVVEVSEYNPVISVYETIASVVLSDAGPQGVGVAAGGLTGQVLTKTSNSDYVTGWSTPVAIGDPLLTLVRNMTGSTLAKGTIVYISGSNGNNVQVSPAIASSETTSARSFGFIYADITQGNDGYVITEGYLTGLNTAGLTSGQQLYLSGTTAGSWTTTKPYAPTHLVYVGVVTRVNQNNGSIYVKVQNGYELDELHDVDINHTVALNAGDVLVRNNANSLWQNQPQSVLTVSPSQVSGTAVITSDARLSDARTPTAHASTHGSAGSDPVTIAESQVTNLTTDLAAKVDSTTLRGILNYQSSGVDTFPRYALVNAAYSSGYVFFTFFTASNNVTVSQVTMGNNAAASGLTSAKMGLYSVDGSDNSTLVARTANDTTLFATVQTSYTRSFDTTGGYPATYNLVAGQRYALGVFIAGTTMPSLICGSGTSNVSVMSLFPKACAQLSGQSDLPTSRTSYTASNINFWGRFS